MVIWSAVSGRTLNKILVFVVRLCASVTVTGNDFMPTGLLDGTVATKVKLLPEPPNDWLADPPIWDKSAVTVMPLLAGFCAPAT